MIGRKLQLEQIESLNTSAKSEFVAVLGRRRVGKTYLIDNAFNKQICFQISGVQEADKKAQLENFDRKLALKTKKKNMQSKDWGEAFYNLRLYLDRLPKQKKKHVIFIDELPWMATSKSGCLQQLANLWNDYLSKEKHFILVICGSASSWLAKNVTGDKGGLHNRLTSIIQVEPFTLNETRQFLVSKKINWTELEITKLYMSFGGIPFYLDEVMKGDNATSAIERICFSKLGKLRNEYDHLYKALFYNPQVHQKIVSALASKQKGLLRKEILQLTKLKDGGIINRTLDELLTCGFIVTINQFGKKKRDEVYRLNDEFTSFYHRFMSGNSKYTKGMWQLMSQTQSYKIWMGFAFEFLVHRHIDAVKQKLGIQGVYTEISTHYHNIGKTGGAQIDLLLDRNDNTINYCEIKFTESPYTLDRKAFMQLSDKIQKLKNIFGVKKIIQSIYITKAPIKNNAYSNEIIAQNIILEDLFL
jgi:uncharacterized protein